MKLRQAIVRVPTAICLLAAASVVLAVDGAPSDGERPRLWLRAASQFAWPQIGSAQGPPPPITPALFRKFQFLLAGYQAVGADTEFTFAEWLVLNGITDPREFTGLMWLWWSHGANRHAI